MGVCGSSTRNQSTVRSKAPPDRHIRYKTEEREVDSKDNDDTPSLLHTLSSHRDMKKLYINLNILSYRTIILITIGWEW